MKYYRYLRAVLYFVGTPHWAQGIDKPTLWQYVYQWRIGFGTAHALAKLIHLSNT